MSTPLAALLEAYARLVVDVGLHLRPGQRLLIAEPYENQGVSLDAAPLVRAITEAAYRSGVRYVDVIWADHLLQRSRLRYSPPDALGEVSDWKRQALSDAARNGDALLFLLGCQVDTEESQHISESDVIRRSNWKQFGETAELLTRGLSNWTVAPAVTPAWAAKVFPGLSEDGAMEALWLDLALASRITTTNGSSGWGAHMATLERQAALMTERGYALLRFVAPGTELSVGLATDHRWRTAAMQTAKGRSFTANLPTEEIFTLPHRDKTEGFLRGTRPVYYAGGLIADYSLQFKDGRVVDAHAGTGAARLHKMLASDEGASRLGEVALVPHTNPIASLAKPFFHPLLDENAASHLGLGQGYPLTVAGGENLSRRKFEKAGGNFSTIHVDLMIGSNEMDVFATKSTGEVEKIVSRGEWLIS